MALFTKLFSSRKKSFNKYQDNVRDKLFTFTNDQVRIILFRECDFRGRKLLFDSNSVQKIPIGSPNSKTIVNENDKYNGGTKYVEISNGYGYLYTKPNMDVSQIGEIIFGSVAMSYRGTSYKLHSLETPSRLICSQVFPSPKHAPKTGNSAPSQINVNSLTSSSLEKSTRNEDSGLNFTSSCSGQSVRSTTSETLLVYRRQSTVPLDVPEGLSENSCHNATHSSLLSSSGYGGDHSSSSISSGPQSFPTDLSQGGGTRYSSDSLYRKCLESSSLEYSTSLTNSASADDYFAKSSTRANKIGLSIIIYLSSGEEKKLENFLMEHAALMEWMIWRVRKGVDQAYIRHHNFASLMYELSTNTSQWLVDFLTGAQIVTYLYHSFLLNCDNIFSINAKLFNIKLKHLPQDSILRTFSESKILRNSDKLYLKSSSSCVGNKQTDFTIFDFTKYLNNEWEASKCKKNDFTAEKFIKELCELLETVDAKHTNFFISTLVTAVLTQHLGWVKTVIPESFENESNCNNTNKPLWGQLNDLYGAIGHPTKISHTIITGTNKAELISKILNSLTYFIRCGNIKRKYLSRVEIEKENYDVDLICHKNACIPKENYKKYEDHLREMVENNRKNEEIDNYNKMEINNKHYTKNEYKVNNNSESFIRFKEVNDNSKFEENIPTIISKSLGLTKASTCLTNLDKLTESDSIKINKNELTNVFITHDKNTEIYDRVTNLGLQAITPGIEPEKFDFTSENIDYKIGKMNKITSHNILYNLEAEQQQLIDINEAKQQIERVFSPKKLKTEETCFNFESKTDFNYVENVDKNVVFVLGENERLVGLKRDKSINFGKLHEKENVECAPKSNVDNVGTAKPNDNIMTVKIDNNRENLIIPSKEYTKTLPIQDSIKHTNSMSTRDVMKSNNVAPGKENILDKTTKHNVERLDNRETKSFSRRPTALNLDTTKKTIFYCESSDSSPEEVVKNNFRTLEDAQILELCKRNCEPYDTLKQSQFKDDDFFEYSGNYDIKPSTSFTTIDLLDGSPGPIPIEAQSKTFKRAQSEPPEGARTSDVKSTTKYRYSGTKFNLQQYPQIVKNYMKSKNIELTNIQFAEKAMHFNTMQDDTCDLSNDDGDYDDDALHTPSNASELEFTSDLILEKCEPHKAKENLEVPKTFKFIRNHTLNTVVKEPVEYKYVPENRLNIVELPMPKSIEVLDDSCLPPGFTSSLMRGLGDRYISNMVLQGTYAPKSEWELNLRKDLQLASRHSPLETPVEEAVAIVANIDTWEVQLISSHTYMADKSTNGEHVGMSQLVANMLESLLHMWRLHTPPEYCIMHIEQRLQEFCMRSKALAQLLLGTEFCSMELLTSTLQLEVNDVPLLMAVASTHSPKVTQKYGVSFQ